MASKKKFVLFPFMQGWNLGNRIAFIGLLVSVIGIFIAIISLGQSFFARKHEVTVNSPANPSDSIKSILQTNQRLVGPKKEDSIHSIPISQKNDSIFKAPKSSIKKSTLYRSDSTLYYYNVILILPMRMNNAEILVDGKLATITENLQNIKIIQVEKKVANHFIEVKDGSNYCSKSISVQQDSLKVTPCQ